MNEHHVTLLIRLSFAAVAAASVALAPVTWAQEASGNNTIDLKNLVFFKSDSYSVTYEDSVSRTALSSATVRKIGYGKTTVVNVITTSTGVYSSDAMTSPYILYPGVHVERLPAAADDSEGGGSEPRLAYWTSEGWVATPFVTAGSFSVVSRTPSGAVVVNGSDGRCVVTATVARC